MASSTKPPGPPGRPPEKEARLAAALRRNLQRRKAQERGREDAESPDGAEPDKDPA